MLDIKKLVEEFSDCPCGVKHELNIKDIVIGSGIVKDTGDILKRNGFGKKLLFVADNNTLKASQGILDSLKDFDLTMKMYDDLREATVIQVEVLKDLLKDADGVISVGTGSLNDICRKAAADMDKPLCIFATAPSMDGFASYGAPLTDGNFKNTYSAKSPEVIIADTKILASAPAELKSAGFGDMIGKYVGLIDWEVSHIISGEYYCEKVANLTRTATDKIMALADRITADDEESAAAVFEALLLTGIGMSFTKTSRPASGTEHIVSHYWECMKLLEGKLSDFHGKKVGVATLLIMEIYDEVIKKTSVKAHKPHVDWQDVYANYGVLQDDVKKLNSPDIAESVNPKVIEENWERIRQIVLSVPRKDEILDAMKRAGCAITTKDIAVSDELREKGLKYHPYMRSRLSLRRVMDMID